jgi:hypothetical protein
MLASLKSQLCLGLALCALQSQHDLLGGLRLLVEHWFCLTTITTLLSVVTTLSLGEQRGLSRFHVRLYVLVVFFVEIRGGSYLSCLVLGDLVLGVLLAVLALAISASCLWNVDLLKKLY